MGYLLYYRGEGKALMAGVKEYVVLLDLDDLTVEDQKDNCAPGFELHSVLSIDEDMTELPTEMPLSRSY